ncbi:MAG TPA: DUF4129 domain-containing protein [Thermoplasmata archaeon]|nr:DUF4129 domain-containing protein [Thermoplasmata archaeon]
MPSTSRGRAAWAIPLLLFLAMLLAAGLAFNLANLNTGGEQMPGPGTPGTTAANPWGLFDPIVAQLVFGVAIAGLVVAFVLALLLRQRGVRAKRVLKPTTWADVVAMILAFGIFMALLLLWPQIVSRVGRTGSAGNVSGNGGANATAIPSAGGIPLGIFLAAAVFGAVVALALFLRVGLNLGRRGPAGPIRQGRLAAVRAVETAISELQLGGDVRTVVLACYARFCYFLGARGIAEQEPLTPRELEGLAITRLAVSHDSAESLTSLFEEARYSEHALGESDRDRAVQSLEQIRADLGV